MEIKLGHAQCRSNAPSSGEPAEQRAANEGAANAAGWEDEPLTLAGLEEKYEISICIALILITLLLY